MRRQQQARPGKKGGEEEAEPQPRPLRPAGGRRHEAREGRARQGFVCEGRDAREVEARALLRPFGRSPPRLGLKPGPFPAWRPSRLGRRSFPPPAFLPWLTCSKRLLADMALRSAAGFRGELRGEVRGGGGGNRGGFVRGRRRRRRSSSRHTARITLGFLADSDWLAPPALLALRWRSSRSRAAHSSRSMVLARRARAHSGAERGERANGRARQAGRQAGSAHQATVTRPKGERRRAHA